MTRSLVPDRRRCPDCITASIGEPAMLALADENVRIGERNGRTFFYSSSPGLSEGALQQMLDMLASIPTHVVTPEEDETMWLRFCEGRTECICGGTGYVGQE